jgi:hypothetical protein
MIIRNQCRREVEGTRGELAARVVEIHDLEHLHIGRQLVGIVLLLIGVPLLAWAAFL